MTHDALEEYIIRMQPQLKKYWVNVDNGSEYYQQTLLDMFRKVEVLHITTDQEFLDIFLQYYRQLSGKRFVQDEARALTRETLITEHSYVAGDEYPCAKLVDPWTSPQAQAKEYINMIGNSRIRGIMRDYYIYGKTLEEIGTEHSISGVAVRKVLLQGIEWIKYGLSVS